MLPKMNQVTAANDALSDVVQWLGFAEINHYLNKSARIKEKIFERVEDKTKLSMDLELPDPSITGEDK